jgi:zinc protease
VITLLIATAAADPVLDALRVPPHTAVLDNGLTVVVHPDPWSPIVSSALFYKVGAAEDPAGASGTAHLLEHLMFEGSANAPNGGYDTLLAAVGGTNNAWTDHDWTVYTATVPPGALELLLFLESDRMAWLSQGLQPEHFANQQAVVRNERLGDESDDHAWSTYALSASLWPDSHPYHQPVLGTLAELESASPQHLLRWHQAWYRPSNAVLVLVGNLDPEVTLDRARRAFADVPVGSPVPPRATAELRPLAGEQRRLLTEDMSRERLYLAWRTVPRGHPDEPALDVLSGLLSGGRGTPLDDALFYGSDLATSVGAWTHNGRLGGEFVVYAVADDQELEDLVAQVDLTLAQLQADGVSADDVVRVVAGWRSAFVRELENRGTLAGHLGDCVVAFDDPGCRASELERYLAVTPNDVQRVARTWLGPDRVVLSVVTPGEEHLAVPGSTLVVPP